MGRVLAVISTLLVGTVLAAGASAGPDTFVNVLQAKNRFKAASGGYILQKSNGGSYPGHYVALDLGVPTISKKVKFGQFTLYLVVNRDSQADVDKLLADAHTGQLGSPDSRGIHWEKGLALDGQVYWLAKKRYGKNLVLWWYALGAQKTDRAFANLNTILLKKVAI